MAIPDHAGLINDEGLRNARGTPGGGDPSPLVCPNGNIRIAPFGEQFCSIGWLVLIVDPIYRSDTGFGDAHQEWGLGSARKAPGRKYVHQDNLPGKEGGSCEPGTSEPPTGGKSKTRSGTM